jgi:hypothetical protein
VRKQKTFDCVRMKDDIQEPLLSQWEGMSDAEVIRTINRDLDTSESPVAVWWRSIERKHSAVSRASAVAH